MTRRTKHLADKNRAGQLWPRAEETEILSQPLSFCQPTHLQREHVLSNGWRYPLVGGTRQRYFAGTNLKLRKTPENAQTPTSRVHAVLARFLNLESVIIFD